MNQIMLCRLVLSRWLMYFTYGVLAVTFVGTLLVNGIMAQHTGLRWELNCRMTAGMGPIDCAALRVALDERVESRQYKRHDIWTNNPVAVSIARRVNRMNPIPAMDQMLLTAIGLAALLVALCLLAKLGALAWLGKEWFRAMGSRMSIFSSGHTRWVEAVRALGARARRDFPSGKSVGDEVRSAFSAAYEIGELLAGTPLPPTSKLAKGGV